jgi:hypothetical protein
LHISEYIVVDVAEKLDFGLHSPVIPSVGQSRVFVEHATVPSAHSVVRRLVGILDIGLFQDLV